MAKKKSKNNSGEFNTSDNSPTSPFNSKSTSYYVTTDKLLQFFDTYLVYCMMTGILIFGYCVVFGTFPFNAFLASFIYAVGCFVLVANLRNAETPGEFGEFVACALVLNAFVSNYLG